jgi:hypothetical protein
MATHLFYESGEHNPAHGSAVRTTATSHAEFLSEYSAALLDAIQKKSTAPLVAAWNMQAFELAAKLRGYKAEGVHESRVLWTGDISPWPSAIVAAAGESDGSDMIGIVEGE